MPSMHPDLLDFGLNVLDAAANQFHICHTEPTTYAQVATYSVGNKSGAAGSICTSPSAGSPSGRKVQIAVFSDGVITATSTGAANDAEFWAVVDSATSRLLAAGALTAAQMVTAGNTFGLTAAIDVTLRGLT